MASRSTIDIMLSLVIGLALVGTVATSATSGSTALAGFSGAQALVIILPLVFVAILIYDAARHVGKGKNQVELGYAPVSPVFTSRVQWLFLRAVRASLFWVKE